MFNNMSRCFGLSVILMQNVKTCFHITTLRTLTEVFRTLTQQDTKQSQWKCVAEQLLSSSCCRDQTVSRRLSQR